MNNLKLKLWSSLVAANFFFTGNSSADLLIYYAFNNKNGSNVVNNGTQEDGTLVGGATYGASKDATFGQAFYGNRTGANDGYERLIENQQYLSKLLFQGKLMQY